MALAENCVVAMQRLRQSLARDAIDLLPLDIEMPELAAFGVLEEMKADRTLRDLPKIVTSSVDGLANIVGCSELGAEDYLPKPVNAVLLRARVNAGIEKKRLRAQQQELVSRFATAEVAQDMAQSGFALGGRRVQASAVVSDIRGCTSMVEQQSPEETIELLNTHYILMFDAINSHGGVVNQMTGDRVMAIFGAPLAARKMPESIALLNADRQAGGKAPPKVAIGIATGDVVDGYTGTQQRAAYTYAYTYTYAYACIGDTVNLAVRLEAHTKEAQRMILIDDATCAALGGRMPVTSRRLVQLKSKAGSVDVYAVHP